jgi:dipeptidyl aminopeptidase/acylaminoacyl peptidase
MDRDLRSTPLYREIEEHFRKVLEPGFGRISGAMDPAPSPDGRTVAFTGAKLDKLEGTAETRICLIDLGSGDLREATGGPHHDRLPKWSPDGSRLAFLSDRAEPGRFQPYLLEAGRVGEAQAAPEVEGTVEYLAWSPDGASVLLGVAGLGADKAGAEGSGTTSSGSGDVPAWVPDVEGVDDVAERRRLDLWDMSAGTVATVSPDGLNVWEAAWCGPGTIAAIASEGAGEDAWYWSRLVAIDVATREARDLYHSGRVDRQIGLPAASPSGGRIALVEALASDRGVLAGDVVLIDPATGASTRPDAAGTDVTWIAWRDGDRLFYAGQRGLDTVAGDIDASTGTATELWANGESFGQRYPEAEPVGDGFVAVLESYDRPPEIAVFRDGKFETVRSLAHDGHRHLGEVAGRLERVSWPAGDGREIEGLLLVPEGPGPHPLLVHVHGGPIWAYRNRWALGYGITPLLVSRGYAVLHPNPRGSAGRGQEFADLVVGDMGGDDAQDVLAGIEALVERGVADGDRVGVFGGSYGGFMAAWLPTLTDRIAASVAISPVTDWYSQHWNSNIGAWDAEFLKTNPAEAPGGAYFERSPVMFASKVTTPVLLTAGLQDRCTPPGQAIEFYRALREHGVETEVVLYPQEGHGVRNMPALFDYSARIVGWFERFMPAAKAAS